ncbi:MAG: energy transducer TonB [Proteobacteria bacterium]|nr:energy transducer TonB [Pseudomonadota bacterium]
MKKILVVLVAAALSWASVAIAQDQPVRSIVNVTGDLYRFRENNHYGVFLVTDEGIILADPISHDNAQWLKGQLAERFGVPVKYVIYSHDHADHTSGGEVFADTATFVAHENAAPKIAASGHTPVPDITINGTYFLKLGKITVRLRSYWASSHSDNLLAMFFSSENTLFLVDLVGVKRLPYQDLQELDIKGAIQSLVYFNQLSYRKLVPGHGKIGREKDLIDHRDYLINLLLEGLKAKQAGLSLDQAKKSILLEEYKDWEGYDSWRELNIEGIYRIIDEKGLLEEFENKKIVFLLSTTNPKFPFKALAKGICGWARVEYEVNNKGQTRNVKLINSEPIGVFGPTTINAAKKYRYVPGFPGIGIKTLINYEIEGECKSPQVREHVED